jgi:hypothetical protein
MNPTLVIAGSASTSAIARLERRPKRCHVVELNDAGVIERCGWWTLPTCCWSTGFFAASWSIGFLLLVATQLPTEREGKAGHRCGQPG